MELLFFIFSALLFLTHGIFFFRALYFKNRSFKVKFIDRTTKNISLILLLPTLILGTILVVNVALKIALWLPFIAIIASNFNKNFIRGYPFALPTVNLILYIGVISLSLGVLL